MDLPLTMFVLTFVAALQTFTEKQRLAGVRICAVRNPGVRHRVLGQNFLQTVQAYSLLWHTASILFPSGSSTNAP
jgi:hypothetical protein